MQINWQRHSNLTKVWLGVIKSRPDFLAIVYIYTHTQSSRVHYGWLSVIFCPKFIVISQSWLKSSTVWAWYRPSSDWEGWWGERVINAWPCLCTPLIFEVNPSSTIDLWDEKGEVRDRPGMGRSWKDHFSVWFEKDVLVVVVAWLLGLPSIKLGPANWGNCFCGHSFNDGPN